MSVTEPVSNNTQKNDLFKIYRTQYKFSFIGHIYFSLYILMVFLYYFLNLSDYPYQIISYTTSIDLLIIYTKYSLFIVFTLMSLANIIIIPILAYLVLKEYRSNKNDTKIQNYHINIGIVLSIVLLIIPLSNAIYKIFLSSDSYYNQSTLAVSFLYTIQLVVPIIFIAGIIYMLIKPYSKLTLVQCLGIIGITFINSFIFYYIVPIITGFLLQFMGTMIPQMNSLEIFTTGNQTQMQDVIIAVLVYVGYNFALDLVIYVCFALLTFKVYSFVLKHKESQINKILFGYTAIAIILYIILSYLMPGLGYIQELWQPLNLENLILSLVNILPHLQVGFYSMGFVISMGIMFSHFNKSKIDQETLT